MRRLLLHLLSSFVGTWIFIFTALYSMRAARRAINDKSPESQSVSAGHYRRIIIVVIDALRSDYLISEKGCQLSDTFIRTKKAVERLRGSILLKRVYADAPTSTTQRLKALGVGNIPPVFEIDQNFFTGVVSQDNWLKKAKHANKTVALLGDDTWEKLYPDVFSKSISKPVDSLNVMDMDCVDLQIIERLYRLLGKDDWDVLIAHFLGVDHCGHKYHIRHAEMDRKLREMDEVVSNLTQLLREGDLLLVFGDHGMTPSGGHGGSSRDETDTAFVAFSLGDKFKTNLQSTEDCQRIDQIDIVPTVSLLTNVSIPYTNLGMVLTELLPETESNLAVEANALQIERYVDHLCREENRDHFCQDLFEAHRLRNVDPQKYQKTVLSIFRNEICAIDWRLAFISFIGLIASSFVQYAALPRNSKIASQTILHVGFLIFQCYVGFSNSYIEGEFHILFAGILACLVYPYATNQRGKHPCVLTCALLLRLAFSQTNSNSFVPVRFEFLTLSPLFVLLPLLIHRCKWLIDSQFVIVMLAALALLFNKGSLLWACANVPQKSAIVVSIHGLVLLLANSVSWPALAVLLIFLNFFRAVDFGDCILLHSMSDMFFYATGHLPNFAAIEWRSAFRFDHVIPIAHMSPDMQNYIRMILILLETYSGRLLCLSSIVKNQEENESASEGLKRVREIMFIATLKVSATTVATCIHIRHLYIIAVFFPYLLFQICSYAVTCVTSFALFCHFLSRKEM